MRLLDAMGECPGGLREALFSFDGIESNGREYDYAELACFCGGSSVRGQLRRGYLRH